MYFGLIDKVRITLIQNNLYLLQFFLFQATLTKQRAAITLLASFCKDTKCDYSQYVPQLIRSLILLFTSPDQVVLTQAWNALNSVTKTLDTSDQMAHVADVRQAVRFAGKY